MDDTVQILDYDERRDYAHIIQSCKNERWQSFYEEREAEYRAALAASHTFVLYVNGAYAGFLRGISDGLFTLFIPELIVDEQFRRRGLGARLIAYIRARLPRTRTELISDNDAFYQKLGFHTVGTGMRKHDWY